MKRWLVVCGLLFSAGLRAGEGPEKLMLLGGGGYPGKTVDHFCDWAGGKDARLVLIHWADEFPTDRVEYKSAFHRCVGHEESAPGALDVIPEKISDLLKQIENATAIFFTGGNQNYIMRVVLKYPEIGKLFHKLYAKGIPFGGTSAGTAIMSATMITGDGPVEGQPQDLGKLDPKETVVAPGLGLITTAVLDQHFIKQHRLARLLNVLLQKKETLAIGVDEEASAIVEGNRRLTVLGGQAMTFSYEEDPKDGVYRVLDPGDVFDLIERKRLAPQ